jgi:hypothetical protein
MRICLEIELIAEALYRARMLQTDLRGLDLPFDRLPAPTRAVYREAAEIAVRRLDPWVHAGALTNASRQAPGFERALEVYHGALTLGPRALAGAPPAPTVTTP